MRNSSLILDIYDDPQGHTFVELLGGRELPVKLASARLLSPEALQALPDRLFGLVADYGEGRLRKYAMCDEAHLFTSITYFLGRGDALPELARSKVAANLVNACAWYDMDPPEALVKIALGVGGALTAGLGAMDLTTRTRDAAAKGRQTAQTFRQAQVSGVKVAGRELELTPEEEHSIAAGGGLPPRIMGAVDQFSQPAAWKKLTDQMSKKNPQLEPNITKQSDLTGTEMMPRGALSVPTSSNPSKRVSLAAKTAAGKLAGLVSAEHQLVGDLRMTPSRAKQAAHTHFIFPNQYPIDTVVQVKTASDYFDQHEREFNLDERRAYSQALCKRASELGVEVSEAALKYAGSGYGPYIEAELLGRERGAAGTSHERVYSALRTKQAEMDPEIFVGLLKMADRASGVDQAYGRHGVGLRDPYQAVFGVLRKSASTDEQYEWSAGNDYVSGIQLHGIAQAGDKLDEYFGDGFTQEFQKDPVGVFKSLPEPQKVVLSRVSKDSRI